MTNLSAVQFSSASLQRATYSDYYGESCWKGGVGVQFCGWLLLGLLWGGGVSDSDYNNNKGYLEGQTKFAEMDRVGEDEKLILSTNGLEKGYRAKMAAWKNGKQIAIQPPYDKSDKRFTGR